MHRVLGEHREKVALVDDQQPVQALAANGTDPAFGEGVGSWRLRWGPEHADASTGEYVIEGQGELRVPVADQELHPVPDIIQIEHQIARLLGDLDHEPRSTTANRPTTP